jgi:tetratricopeptide (TPR) repeat protein
MTETPNEHDDSGRSVCWEVLNSVSGFADLPQDKLWPVLMVNALGASKSGELFEDDLRAIVAWADEAQNRAKLIQQLLLGRLALNVNDGEVTIERRDDDEIGTELDSAYDGAAAQVQKISIPDCERAAELVAEAETRADQGDIPGAIALIEEAIRLDSIAALDTYHAIRADLYNSLGDANPARAIEMYNYAGLMKRKGRLRDAMLAYQEASALDPAFPWSLNNLAWMLATSQDSSTRHARLAVKYSEEACEKSNWSCWAFLGTLAAAFAAAGEFEQAVQWQEASMHLVPDSHRLDSQLMLRCFRLGQRYVDEGMSVAAGESDGDSEQSRKLRLLDAARVSTTTLREIFDDAFFDTELDEDDNLWICDRFRVLVKYSDSGEQVTFAVLARPRDDASLESCRELIHRVNTSLQSVRAGFHETQIIVFDQTVPVAGGVTPAAMVYAMRFFIAAVRAGISAFDADGVVFQVDDSSESA